MNVNPSAPAAANLDERHLALLEQWLAATAAALDAAGGPTPEDLLAALDTQSRLLQAWQILPPAPLSPATLACVARAQAQTRQLNALLRAQERDGQARLQALFNAAGVPDLYAIGGTVRHGIGPRATLSAA